MRRTMARAQDGFTFVEVMQALVLAAIGLLALSSLTMGTIRANAKARRMTTAATVGEDKMESLRSTAYGAVTEGSDQVTEAGVTYARSWTVCTNCPVRGTKEISLTVQWMESGPETVKFATVLAE